MIHAEAQAGATTPLGLQEIFVFGSKSEDRDRDTIGVRVRAMYRDTPTQWH